MHRVLYLLRNLHCWPTSYDVLKHHLYALRFPMHPNLEKIMDCIRLTTVQARAAEGENSCDVPTV